MIDYEALAEYAPPASGKEERDQWFRDHDYEPDDLLRIGEEVGRYRLADLVEGDKISENELLLAMVLAFTFGFELAVRCERDEAPDLTPPPNSNGNGAS